MNLETATTYAKELRSLLEPHTARVEIAGGVRRGKKEPHDIELVVKPTDELIFGYLNSVDQAMRELVMEGVIAFGDPVLVERQGKELLSKAPFAEKYYRVKYKGEKVDVFVVTPPAQWGVDFLLRTGDGGHNIWIVKQGWAKGIYFRHGHLVQHVDGKGRYISEAMYRKSQYAKCDLVHCGFITLKTPEEEDVFRALGIPFKEPWERVAWGEVESPYYHEYANGRMYFVQPGWGEA